MLNGFQLPTLWAPGVQPLKCQGQRTHFTQLHNEGRKYGLSFIHAIVKLNEYRYVIFCVLGMDQGVKIVYNKGQQRV